MPIALGIAIFGALGALAIGLVFALVLGRTDVPEWLRLSITTGFLGGFTTFSAFSLQTHRLLAEGAYGLGVVYVVGSVAAGLVAVGIGILVGRAI